MAAKSRDQAVNRTKVAAHSKAMTALWKDKPVHEKGKALNAEELQSGIIAYLDHICDEENPLMPTMAGLSLFLGVSETAFWKWAKTADDERCEIIRQFRDFVQEAHNQAGLQGVTNTLFEMYYLKSRLGQSDTPNEKTININFGSAPAFYPTGEQAAQLLENIPLTAEFEDKTDLAAEFVAEADEDSVESAQNDAQSDEGEGAGK